MFAVVELQLPDGTLGEGIIRFKVCQGDVDGDGDTDQDDLDFMLFTGFGPADPCPRAGDFTGEGYLDQDDLDVVIFDFGCGQD